MYRTLLIVIVLCGTAVPRVSAQVSWDTLFVGANPIFNPGAFVPPPDRTDAKWEFKTSADQAITGLVVNSEGRYDNTTLNPYGYYLSGAAGRGFAHVTVRSQDEIRNSSNQVLSSADMTASWRVMGGTFGADPWNPTIGQCQGTQCPLYAELYSDRNIRNTAGGGGSYDVTTNNRRRFVITGSREDPDGVGGRLRTPDMRAPAGTRAYLCVDDQGYWSVQPLGCQ